VRTDRITVAALTALLVGAVAALCALAVHHACFHPSQAFARPERGTPRAQYCSAVSPGAAWLILIGVPMACAAAVAAFLRGRVRLFWAAILLICVLICANAWVVNALTFSYTI
jgi:hypothetical protein